MRSTAFAIVFLASYLHLSGREPAPGLWVLFVVILLLYPHLQYWRACRSAKPIETEMRNLLIDSVLLGVFIAAVGFAQWIVFAAVLGSLSNNVANQGWRGAPNTLLALFGGALLWIAFAGFHYAPETEWYASLVCIFGLSAYLLGISHLSYTRNLQLRHTREQLKSREQDLLSANQSLLANLAEIAGLQDQLRDQANRDPLTGLYNRRYLDRILSQELSRCGYEGYSLALIMIDIDHFKQINDTYGHQAGDEMLVQLAAVLEGNARSSDVACRYGGEEFMLVMPDIDRELAMAHAEHLRRRFAAHELYFDGYCLKTTLSIGVAIYPEDAGSAALLVSRADQAMYQAKNAGRDRVGVAGASPLIDA